MNLYNVYGIVLGSIVSLPELAVGCCEPAWSFYVHNSKQQDLRDVAWLDHKRNPDGSTWLSIAKIKSDYLLHFSEIVSFYISLEDQTITSFPAPEIPQHTITHLLLDQVLPRVLHHQAGLVLHASSVVIGDYAVGFMGVSGAGKSTMSASLCQEGCPLVADDVLRLTLEDEQVLASPGYPGLRLWSSSLDVLSESTARGQQVAHYSDKVRVPTRADLPFCDAPVPLQCIFLLNTLDEIHAIQIEELSARESLIELLKASFILDVTDKHSLIRDQHLLAQLVRQVPVFKLTYPHDLSAISDVHQAILTHIKSHPFSMRG